MCNHPNSSYQESVSFEETMVYSKFADDYLAHEGLNPPTVQLVTQSCLFDTGARGWVGGCVQLYVTTQHTENIYTVFNAANLSLVSSEFRCFIELSVITILYRLQERGNLSEVWRESNSVV